jgi:hypothetical protein
MTVFLAYYAQYEGEDYCTVLHAETRGKAKYRFARVDPAGNYDRSRWNEIRLYRLPKWDNKPFRKGDEYNQLFAPDSYDDNGEGVYDGYSWIDCDCPLCKEVR